MTTLILDTSTELCIVGVAHRGTLLKETLLAHHNHLSGTLLPLIQKQLSDSDLTPQHLKGIALGIGPGSYTGTRVGASVAKSLAFALNIPLYPFLSPCAFIPKEIEGTFVFLIETKPGPYFLLKGTRKNEQLQILQSGLISPQDVASSLALIDSIILAPSAPLPPCLPTSAPVVRAEPRLSPLLPFLDTLPPTPAELVALEYLHTPFFS